MNQKKKTYNPKTRSITALVVYLFLLSSIAFHHHPFSLSVKGKSNFESTSDSEPQFLISSNSCPIVHFAQNPFQSLIDENSSEVQLEYSTFYSFESIKHFQVTSLLHYSLRAPPLST